MRKINQKSQIVLSVYFEDAGDIMLQRSAKNLCAPGKDIPFHTIRGGRFDRRTSFCASNERYLR